MKKRSRNGARICAISALSVLAVPAARAQKAELGAPILPAFAPQRVPPGRDRFLAEPVLTTDALVEALKTNKVFRRNIAKHFKLPEDRVVSFVQDALVPYILPEDTKVNNFGVTKSGLVYGKLMTLKKGTRVWATRSGNPILKWICSNPLTTKVPILKKPPKPIPVTTSQQKLGVKQVASNEIAPAGLEGLPGGQVALEKPVEPPVVVVKEPLKGNGSNATPATKPIRSIARAGLPLLPLAGVIGAVVRSVPQPTGTVDPEADPEDPNLKKSGPHVASRAHTVPEPGSLLLVGLGALALPLLRRRK